MSNRRATFTDVLAEIKTKLAWRGPTGRTMGHIVIEREEAEVLVRGIKDMQHSLNALEGKQ